MFGTYRFILALAVALDHMGLFPNYHVGSSAVVGFFILSGYVMAHSFSKHFQSDLRQTTRFFLDRLLRIYPVYALLLVVIVGFFLVTERESTDLNPKNAFSHLTLIPLNFFAVLPQRAIYMLRDHSLIPIPPSPTLAIEIQFYLLLPVLFVYRTLAHGLFLAALAVFTLASYGSIPYALGHTYLTGFLFIFLSGMFLYDVVSRPDHPRSRAVVVGTCAYLGVLLVGLAWIGRAHTFVTLEVIVGFELGMVSIYVLAQVKRTSALDFFLGNLSYPLFLAHWFAIWLFEFLGRRLALPTEPRARVVLQLTLALLVSTAAWILVDSRVQRYRKGLQQRPRPVAAASVPPPTPSAGARESGPP